MRILILYIFIIISLFSCGSVKEIAKIDKEIASISRKNLISIVKDSSLNYSAVLLKKVNISISEKGSISSYNGSIRIIKDSAIWISLNAAFGIEVVRMLLTKDSLSFVDRYHKQYYTGDYAFLSDIIGIDLNFPVIQSLLTNDLLNYEAVLESNSSLKFDSQISDGYYILMSMKKSKFDRKLKQVERNINSNKNYSVIYQTNFVNPKSFKVNKIYITELYKDWKMNVTYSDYSRISNNLMPQEILFSFLSLVKEMSCTLKYSGTEFVDTVSIPFKIPSNYEQILK